MGHILDFYMEHHVKERVLDKDRVLYANAPILAFFGDRIVADLDDPLFIEYAQGRRAGTIGATGRPVMDGTIRRELEHLRAALIYAGRNPKRTGVKRAEIPAIVMPEKPEPRSLVLTQAQLDRLMAAAMGPENEPLTRAYRFIAIARYTAARRESILSLTWDRVDLKKRLIDFREPGRRQTAKRRVAIPIDPHLLPILIRAKRERDAQDPKPDFVLDTPGAVKRTFATAVRNAKLPGTTPHTLRHSWATDASERGVPVARIALFMGDSVDTVERNYIHRSVGYLTDVLPDRGSVSPA